MLLSTPKILKCSIGRRFPTECGLSPRFPSIKECIPISSCKLNIETHLKALHLSKNAVETEGELILLRAGIHDGGSEMTTCPKHRQTLGIYWRRSRKCAHPFHGSSNRKPTRTVSKEVSIEIDKVWEVLVPVGSGNVNDKLDILILFKKQVNMCMCQIHKIICTRKA